MADSMVFVSKHGIFKPYEYLKFWEIRHTYLNKLNKHNLNNKQCKFETIMMILSNKNY